MDKWSYESIYEEVLAFGIQKRFAEDIKRANIAFIEDDSLQDAQGFDEWYVFNYNTLEDKTICRLAEEAEVSNANLLSNTFRGFFEVSVQRDTCYIKDILTGEDYKLVGENLSEGAIVSMRIGFSEAESAYVAFCETYNFEPLYKDVIKKYILSRYNEVVKSFGPMPLVAFLQKDLLLVFKMHNIVNTLYDETDVEEELLLHEATYAYKCSTDELVGALEHLPFTLYLDEEDSDLLRVVHEEVIIAEIEFVSPKLNILCNSEQHLAMMMKAIDALNIEALVFMKKDILTIDNVLE